jgi:hypothetical protein
MEPGHFLVLIKSERATNSSLGIVTLMPFGETATYCPDGSERDEPASLAIGKLAQSFRGGASPEVWSTSLLAQTFVSGIRLPLGPVVLRYGSIEGTVSKQQCPQSGQ